MAVSSVVGRGGTNRLLPGLLKELQADCTKGKQPPWQCFTLVFIESFFLISHYLVDFFHTLNNVVYTCRTRNIVKGVAMSTAISLTELTDSRVASAVRVARPGYWAPRPWSRGRINPQELRFLGWISRAIRDGNCLVIKACA